MNYKLPQSCLKQNISPFIKQTKTSMILCEIVFADAKKVLVNIIMIWENLICIYFQHT